MTLRVEAERRFKSEGELERYELFLQLYASKDPGERQALREILSGDDPLLKILILQYLEDLPEAHALRLALPCLEDQNPVVRQSAARAYQRNHCSGKHRLLRPYLRSKNSRAARFAVRTLGRAGDADILPLILTELPSAPEDLRDEMLGALRFLPDARSVPVLRAFTSHASDETRYRALRAVSEIVNQGAVLPAQLFLDRMNDASDRVRRLALDMLQHYPSRDIAAIFLKQALSADEPLESRQRAISAVASFPHPDWVEPLVRLMTSSGSSALRLRSEIALKRFPAAMLKRGLLPLLKHPESSVRQQAMLIMANALGADPAVREKLFELWSGASDEQAKLSMMEVLGELGGEAVPKLLEALESSPLLAYASVGTLNRLWSAATAPRILAILKNPKVPDYVKQALLSALIKRPPDESIRAELRLWLIAALSDEVINIRYLSAQVLAWYPIEAKLEPLLDLLAHETAPETVEVVLRQLLKGLGLDPRPLLLAYRAHPKRETLTDHLVAVLTAQSWDEAFVFEVFHQLSLAPASVLADRPEAFFKVCLHMMEIGRVELEKIWLFLFSEELRLLFLGLLKRALEDPERHFPELPLEFLALHLAHASEGARSLFYELVALDARSEGVALLAAALLKETDAATLRAGRESLRRLVAGASA